MNTVWKTMGCAALLGCVLPVAAQAGTWTVGAHAERHLSTLQPLAGLAAAHHAEGRKQAKAKIQPVGSLLLGVGTTTLRPVGRFELGLAAPIKMKQAALVVGLMGSLDVAVGPYGSFGSVGDPASAFGAVNLLPGVSAFGELGWSRSREKGLTRWVVGLRMGVVPGLRFDSECTNPTADTTGCARWPLTLQGGVTARLHFAEHVYLAALLGPNVGLTFGASFGPAPRSDEPGNLDGIDRDD